MKLDVNGQPLLHLFQSLNFGCFTHSIHYKNKVIENKVMDIKL